MGHKMYTIFLSLSFCYTILCHKTPSVRDARQITANGAELVKINSTSRASIHILSRSIVFAQMAAAGKKYPRIRVSPGRRVPRMSGQCGASHTSVTLYRTSKYGTGDIPGHDSTTQTHRIYLYDRRDAAASGGWWSTGEERVHLFPSGHVSTELERFEGDEYVREKRLAGTTSQTENTRGRWTDGFWDAARSAGAK